MTTNIQQGTLLDVLKKKMRQTKEEMEKYKDECEEFQKRLQGEVIRREEVSSTHKILHIFQLSFVLFCRTPLSSLALCLPACLPAGRSMCVCFYVNHRWPTTIVFRCCCFSFHSKIHGAHSGRLRILLICFCFI